MNGFARVVASFNAAEWWYGHLMRALAELVHVREIRMRRWNQGGAEIDTDIGALLEPLEARESFYLGSIDQLFRGIPDLPMPSCVWTDVMPSNCRPFLPMYRIFDRVFATQKDAVGVLEQAGVPHVEWLPFAFDTTLPNEPEAPKVFDVGFVGRLDLPATRSERLLILGELEQRFVLNDYRLSRSAEEMMSVYNRSRIVVNIPALGGLNMRTFEALASGALLLTQPVRNGQTELFREGVHFVTYRNTSDLLDKVRYFLAHDAERAGIAAEGRREVLCHHTYGHRARQMLEAMSRRARGRRTDERARLDAYASFFDYLGRGDLLVQLAVQRSVPLRQRVRLFARAAAKLRHRCLRGGQGAEER